MDDGKKKQELEVITKSFGFEFSQKEMKELVDHVDKHEYFLGRVVPFKFSWSDALFSWYENIFTPIKEAADSKRLQAWTGMTAESLFFQMSHEWYMINLKDNKKDVTEPFPIEAVEIVARDYSRHGKLVTRLFSWLAV